MKWRILALTALSSAVLIGSVVVAGLGGASSGMGPDRRGPTGPHVAMPRAGATRCRVIPDTSSATPPPLLAVIGASFTAGTGAPRLADSWAVRLAELIRWRAVTFGVPGAGYTEPGFGDLGPVSSEVDRVRLARLHPSVVVIQAGHDDWRVPRAAEANRVAALVRRLRADVPAARLAFLTVFSRPGESTTVTRGELRTDSAIVSAVRKVDPQAIVIDPLRHHWRFPRARGGLHPTARGHLVIAERVARALVKAGVVAAAANRPSPAGVTCVRLGAATGSLPSLKKPQKFIH